MFLTCSLDHSCTGALCQTWEFFLSTIELSNDCGGVHISIESKNNLSNKSYISF